MRAVVGLSLSSNTAATIICSDGRWCAVEEERFTRIKHNRDPAACIDGFHGSWFPANALIAAMEFLDLSWRQVDLCVFACTGEFATDPRRRLIDYVRTVAPCEVRQVSHHLGHAWSVCDGELQNGDLILVCDGSGSRLYFDYDQDNSGWERLSTFIMQDSRPVRMMTETPRFYYSNKWNRLVRSINSIGFLYRWMAAHAVTTNDEPEGSLMALAAIGRPSEWQQWIREHLLLFGDGGYLLRLNDMSAVDWQDRWPENWPRLAKTFDASDQRECADLAWAAQDCLEVIVNNALDCHLAATRANRCAVAGGCFLNCVMNGKLRRRLGDHRFVLRPGMHDAGVSYGCALAARHLLGWSVVPLEPAPSETACVGTAYPADQTLAIAHSAKGPWRAQAFQTANEAWRECAEMLAGGKVVATFKGRIEFGPRALGHRSIFASPVVTGMRDRLNALKLRANYRPFALALLREQSQNILERDIALPFMLESVTVANEWAERLREGLHVDGTTRVQTVGLGNGSRGLLEAFFALTGVPALINTSLNSKGEPIALSIEDAIQVFTSVPLDAMLVEDRVLLRRLRDDRLQHSTAGI